MQMIAILAAAAALVKPFDGGVRIAEKGETVFSNRAFMLGEKAAAALVKPFDGGVRIAEKGETVFSNRAFMLGEKAAAALGGSWYLFADNDASLSVEVERAGELSVITALPSASKHLSRQKELEAQGFTRDMAAGSFQPFGENPLDFAGVWRKQVAAGEKIVLAGKWSIIGGIDPSNQRQLSRPITEKGRKLLAYAKGRPAEETPRDILENNPDYVVYVPRMPQQWYSRKDKDVPPEKLRLRGDRYNDHFQVISDEKRGLLYAFWTQATWEGCEDQHIAFSKSADRGVTWTEPIVLAGSECRAYPRPRASWQQPMLAKSGRLYCLWNQQTTGRGPHCGLMFGVYSDNAGESWSGLSQVQLKRMDQDDPNVAIPPCWCNWQRPLRLGEGGRFLVGCSHHGKAPYDEKWCCKIEFWQFDNIDDDPEIHKIALSYFATGHDMLDSTKVAPLPGIRYFVPNPREDPAVEEAAIMKLPDGRLFAVMRSSIGAPVWSQSRDNGHTWSQAKALLDHDGGTMYQHPRSPCPFYDWKGPEAGSGIYFGLVHCKFDMNEKTAYQRRGPLYLIAGRFNPKAEQPVEFSKPKLFAPRQQGNSFYTSYTVLDGKGILWFPDKKYYLLGRNIGEEWVK